MTFADVSSCGEQRDCSAVAIGSATDGSNAEGAPTSAKVQVLEMDPEAYARCCPALFANAYAMLRRRVGYLMALDLFSDWPAQDLAFFARWMTELELRMMGDRMYAEGDEADTVYFIVRGSVGLRQATVARDHAVLNIHHICAPSFCGEHEVLAGLPTRAHTAVCTTPETIVMGVPASVFHALVLSHSSRRRYATSAKLAAVLNLRRKWYKLRTETAGDSAEVPFPFLDNPQAECLGPDAWTPPHPNAAAGRMAHLFRPAPTSTPALQPQASTDEDFARALGKALSKVAVGGEERKVGRLSNASPNHASPGGTRRSRAEAGQSSAQPHLRSSARTSLDLPHSDTPRHRRNHSDGSAFATWSVRSSASTLSRDPGYAPPSPAGAASAHPLPVVTSGAAHKRGPARRASRMVLKAVMGFKRLLRRGAQPPPPQQAHASPMTQVATRPSRPTTRSPGRQGHLPSVSPVAAQNGSRDVVPPIMLTAPAPRRATRGTHLPTRHNSSTGHVEGLSRAESSGSVVGPAQHVGPSTPARRVALVSRR